jgi:UDP-galactopyranose mutase
MKVKKILIVGAGPAGAASARKFAEAGFKVEVYDKRPHVAGNCFDELDDHGVLIHRYGPHYFRSNSLELLQWLSNFTKWIPGRYFVRAKIGDILVPMPISLSTITSLKEKVFSKSDFEQYLSEKQISFVNPQNAEEQCLSSVGQELYDALFKDYTKKQWGINAIDLDPSITARIPLRFNWDERYPKEEFQLMPKEGYAQMYKKMLDHSNITIKTESYLEPQIINNLSNHYYCTIYTGAIDEFYGYKHGKLGYRSLKFEWKYFEDSYIQPCVQINYPNHLVEYTRTVETKHITDQICNGTTICYEYPQSTGDPFYPILTKENQDKYVKYRSLSEEDQHKDNPIYFLGRLAEYKYYNMDQILIRSLGLADTIIESFHREGD